MNKSIQRRDLLKAISIAPLGLYLAPAKALASHSENILETNTLPSSIAKHVLPPLPYDYSALEPYIDKQTMQIHHDLHHNGYVKGLIAAEIALENARKSNNYKLVQHWSKKTVFSQRWSLYAFTLLENYGPNFQRRWWQTKR